MAIYLSLDSIIFTYSHTPVKNPLSWNGILDITLKQNKIILEWIKRHKIKCDNNVDLDIFTGPDLKKKNWYVKMLLFSSPSV